MTKSQANALYLDYLRVKIKALNRIAEAEEKEEVRKIFTDSAAENRNLLFTLEAAELEGKEEDLTIRGKDISDIGALKVAVYLHKKISKKPASGERMGDAITVILEEIADEIDSLFCDALKYIPRLKIK